MSNKLSQPKSTCCVMGDPTVGPVAKMQKMGVFEESPAASAEPGLTSKPEPGQ